MGVETFCVLESGYIDMFNFRLMHAEMLIRCLNELTDRETGFMRKLAGVHIYYLVQEF